jgi:hypothetical protein
MCEVVSHVEGQRMNVILPEKLRSDLRHKCLPSHVDAFEKLYDLVIASCPSHEIRCQQRYSGLYRGESIFTYIDPQRDGIHFGFFRDYVKRLDTPPRIRQGEYPDWNPSKGGLVGFWLGRLTGTDTHVLDDLHRLIVESYRWA